MDYPALTNLDALVLMTGEFRFSPGETTLAGAQQAGYIDFGNIVVVGIKPSADKLEHEGSYRGTKKVDKTVVIKAGLEYTLRCDEFDSKKLEIALMGTRGSVSTQAAVAVAEDAVPMDWNLSTEQGEIGRWYPVVGDTGSANVGKQIKNVLTLTLTASGGVPPTLTEDTDFVVDNMNGMFRLLNTANAIAACSLAVTPAYTCAAIVAGNEASTREIVPLNDATKDGMAEIRLYSESHQTTPFYIHRDFRCQITMDSMNDVDGKTWTEMNFTVRVSEPEGTVEVAED